MDISLPSLGASVDAVDFAAGMTADEQHFRGFRSLSNECDYDETELYLNSSLFLFPEMR